MRHFKGAMREQGLLMPYDLLEWLPEDHLARFIVEIVDQLDFSNIYRQYKGKGSAAYDPKLLLALLFYGYSTGVFSSRKLEAASHDSVAFRFITGNQHPDHDTIANFRKRFLSEIQGWFKQILLIGCEMKLVKMGNIYIDGTKIQANASRHKAMSYDYMKRHEEQLEEEIKQLLDMAAEQDENENTHQLVIPKELKGREDRLEKIRQAKVVIETRAKERFKLEKQEYNRKIAKKEKKEKETGKKQGARVAKEPIDDTPRGSDQYNFTDPESRIMKTSMGFNQCYNAQAAVNEDMLIVGAYSNSRGNDWLEFIPAIQSVPKELGKISTAVADTGYFSESNVLKTIGLGIEPIISVKKEVHNSFLKNLLNQSQEPINKDKNIKETMRQLLDSDRGSVIYKKRKQTIEPVFGIIKETLGFRRFLLRGENNASKEWTLVCIGYNLKRLFNLKMIPSSIIN